MNKRTYDQLLNALKAQMQSHPNILGQLVEKGNVAATQGDYDTAASLYNMAVEIDPANPAIEEKRLDAIDSWLKS
jgi:cytochrome c-type biogenesis protein CcmH/NrfG